MAWNAAGFGENCGKVMRSAKLRTMVKGILHKHGYPPDKQEKATLTVLEQAELLCRDLAA